MNPDVFAQVLPLYLGLSAALFCMGVIGVLVRRNAIIIFMSVELMLNSANLAFVAFARYLHQLDGQVIVLVVMSWTARSSARTSLMLGVCSKALR